MKEVLVPILAAVAFIVLVGFSVQALNNGKIAFPERSPQATVEPKTTITVGDSEINIEIADDEKEREKGLSGREKLNKDTGLLFVFNSKNVRPSFWMKDMNFDIDIIWIDDERIVQISSAKAEKKGTSDSDLKLYIPNQEVDYVLEVNSGFADKKDIEVGDEVNLSDAI